jgi:hypothetical protein
MKVGCRLIETKMPHNKGIELTASSVRSAPASSSSSCLAFDTSSTGVERRYTSNSGHWQNSV